jgi:hypothetical protein
VPWFRVCADAKRGALCGGPDVIPYRKFSDTLKNGNYALAPPNPPKASKVDAADRAKADALDGLGALDGLRPEIQKPATAPEPAELIAPAPWFECVARPAEGEPGLEQPCAARRGRVGDRDGVFVHFCDECGRWGPYGYGVNVRADRLGRWYCAAHRPQGTAR